ncbi:hypothetical protein [Dermatobacter hominis]|uniref:hypothetical protein n=1 Tax=Dermatobacter hominis TaxID=2884263 RepID=UPI001D12C28E|nr:hypothetical protein [Dermatobacter hominis]UDY34876.1 hypothetical protein LH044_16240 [Dermatobacter hominis]
MAEGQVRTGRARWVQLLVVVVVALGWAAAPLASAGAADAPGTISGRVTGPNGDPVGPSSGICALLGNSSSGWSNLAADGTYTLTNVEPGVWSVKFEYCSSSAVRTYAPEYYPDIHVRTGAALPNISVAAGQTVTGIDAQLEVGGTIKVKAVDPANAPLADLCVSAEDPPDAVGIPSVGNLPTVGSGMTAADGTATLSGLPTGDYFVLVRECDFAHPVHIGLARYQYLGGGFDQGTAARVLVAPGVTVTPTVTVSAGATVTGRVTRAGQPVGGTCVYWDGRDKAEEISTTTDADGNYTLRGITPTVPGKVYACGTATTTTTWYPQASSRWTADPTPFAPGSTQVRDIQLQSINTVGVIIRGLPNPTGCEVVVTDNLGNVQRVGLRPTALAQAYVADAFGLPSAARSANLECGGKRVGVGQVPDSSTPFWQNWFPQPAVISIAYDVAGPAINATPSVVGRWSRTPVTVSFSCTDAGSGVASCPAPVVLGEGQAVWVSATDKGGNVSWIPVGPALVDATPPRPAITGDGRTFKKGQPLALGCDMVDDRSGLAWVRSDCPAWGSTSLPVGTHRFTVTASDWAGNVTTTTATITIVK